MPTLTNCHDNTSITKTEIVFDLNDVYSGTSPIGPHIFPQVTVNVSDINSKSTQSGTTFSKNAQSFSIYYQNARSIRSHINDIYSCLTSAEFQIVCITESWLDSSISNSEFIPPNHVTFRSDRNFIRSVRQRGGGVVLSVNAQFSVKSLI